MSSLTVITGLPNSGKTTRLLARYRALLAENCPGAALWIAPTWRTAAAVRKRLLDAGLEGCFSPGVMTFDQFAETILHLVPEPIRPLSRLMKRHLVRQLIEDGRAEGRLTYFAPIAATGGLVDLVCDLIGELKRLEIWPEQFQAACAARGLSEKDRELLDIYQGYQQGLLEHHLYDAEGRFWSARDWLKKTWSANDSLPVSQIPWAKLRVVMVDGFTDFTRTQYEILGILAQRVEEMWISLPWEATPARGDLFHKPRKTLTELARRHPDLKRQDLPRPEPSPWPAMTHLEAALFGNPRHAQAAADTSGLEVLAAASQLGEIELIAARIKRLLVDGDPLGGEEGDRSMFSDRVEPVNHADSPKNGPVPARPVGGGRPVGADEIAVVFRQPQDRGGLVGEVFAARGIPVAFESGPLLARAPVVLALTTLLRLVVDDWPLNVLPVVLGSSYFRPAWPEWLEGKALAASDRMIRHLQVREGRQPLLQRLEVLARRESEVPVADAPEQQSARARTGGASGTPGSGTRDAAVAAALLGRLAAALDELPERATLAAWGQAWQRLAEQTGLLRTVQSDDPAAFEIADAAAWNCLQEALRESDQLARALGRESPELDRRAALAALMDLAGSQRMKSPGNDAGRVRILSAASVRGLKVPYLFLAGLCEKSFPSPEREDRLYSEADYQRLIEHGLPLVPRLERNAAEMLLFYEAVTRATRRLYLSYPALDDAAQPLSPSPYLKEVEQACGPGRIARTESSDLSPVPADDEPLSAAEFRVKAVATALDGDLALLAGLLQDERGGGHGVADGVVAGLLLSAQRQDRTSFSVAEGLLTSPVAERRLAADFSAERIFSATELEQYAACPYRYFLAKVLKAQPLEELELEVDYLERGRLAHALMAAFHRHVNQACGEPTSPATLSAEEYQQLLDQAMAEVLDPTASDGLGEVDRRLLLRWMADYRGQHQRYDAEWQTFQAPLRPEFFEVSFGQSLRGNGRPSTIEPLQLCCGEQTILIAGRIDRIDTGRVAGEVVFNVLDYKTGGAVRFSVEAVARGVALQLPLYALAVAEVVLADRDCVPWQAGYWYLSDNGFKPKQALKMYHEAAGGLEPDAAWEAMRALLAKTVAGLVRGMRGGQFPVWSNDPHCTGYCEYATVCRINQIRSLEKVWLPPVNKD